MKPMVARVQSTSCWVCASSPHNDRFPADGAWVVVGCTGDRCVHCAIILPQPSALPLLWRHHSARII